MAINVKIGEPYDIEETFPNPEDREIKVSIKRPDLIVKLPEKEPLRVNLQINKTMSGDLMIKDHPDIDIVVMSKENKIVAFPKNKRTDKVYDTQDRFFNFLAKNGIIRPNKIQSGFAFGSVESLIELPKPNPEKEKDEISPIQVVVYTISKFIDQESEYFSVDEEFEKEFEDSLTDPDEEESTELGEVPHADQKGSIRPGYIYSPYGISSIYRYE